MSIQNRSVVVLGGTRGIGLCVAKHLLECGAKVVVASRSEKACHEALEELQKISPHVAAHSADVTRNESLQKLFEFSQKQFSQINGIVLAAGVYGSIGKFAERPFSEWEESLQINLIGVARALYHALPFLQKNSRVVLFSGGGQGPMPHFSSYVTSKGGLWRFTETMGVELAEREIYVNAIAPGAINTIFLDELLKAGPERVGKVFYEKSLQQKQTGGEDPKKAARLVEYLMSDRSKGLYGKTLSAIWDDYESLRDLEAMSRTEVFTYKRVISPDGRTRKG